MTTATAVFVAVALLGIDPWLRLEVPLDSPTNLVVGRLDGAPLVVVQGRAHGARRAALAAVDLHGRIRWMVQGPAGSTPGAYVHWIDRPGDAWILFSVVPDDPEAPGEAWVVQARDGKLVRRLPNRTHFGNNNSLILDLDGDGHSELIYADQRTLICYRLADFTRRWQVDRRVLFCWSLPTAVDVTGDGKPEIVFGSEYDEPQGTSSFVAVDSRGRIVWASGGYEEDLGSTPVFVADLEGDGQPELLKVGLDLVHRRRLPTNHLYVFGFDGRLRRKVPLGFTGIALGDLDRDGRLEGVGVTNTRDGGVIRTPEIRCVDLVTGKQDWRVRLPRAYLDCNSPVMADFDGDGRLEAAVGTGNPAGYGRLPNSEPWGDLFVVGSGGIVEYREPLPGWPVNMALCDLDSDGTGELLVVVDGMPGQIAVYRTAAPCRRLAWPTPFGSPRRDGTIAIGQP